MSDTTVSARQRIGLSDVIQEPFRLFFPSATLAGVMGVLLWPLHFLGVAEFYPGQAHARVMAYGFFGGFIFGFLGTALPRMLSANPLGAGELVPLFGLYVVMLVFYFNSNLVAGDVSLLVLLTAFLAMAIRRFAVRKDMPPPGFVLIPLAFTCAMAGAFLAILAPRTEESVFWVSLQKLLAYQGFVLLPILGVGGFLLPRFFGWPSRHDLPESRTPPPGWLPRAGVALTVTLVILTSFALEAAGWFRLGPALRFAATLGYLLTEIPAFKPLRARNTLAYCLRIAFVLLVVGFICAALWPGYRVALLHLTLMGGFAVLTLTVATRVIFGHSGNAPRLNRPNRWSLIAVALMLFAMATRISGDLWPKVLVSHYIYGAIIWTVGVIVWGFFVLPKVLEREVE